MYITELRSGTNFIGSPAGSSISNIKAQASRRLNQRPFERIEYLRIIPTMAAIELYRVNDLDRLTGNVTHGEWLTMAEHSASEQRLIARYRGELIEALYDIA